MRCLAVLQQIHLVDEHILSPGVLDLMQLGSTAFSCILLYLNSVGVGCAVQSWILKLGVAMQTLDFWISGFLESRIFRILGFLDFRISGFLDFWFFGFLFFWFSGFLDSRILDFWLKIRFWILGF